MRNQPEAVFQKIAAKFRKTIPLAAQMGILPYKSEGGRWISSPYDGNSWWTGGFWPGLMWQLFAATKEEIFRTEARRAQELLTDEFRTFDLLNHDTGFMYLLSTGADYKLHGNGSPAGDGSPAGSGSPAGGAQNRTDTLHAANLLMGRFNPVGYIRAWNEKHKMGFAIIDCMMNLSLLFWASRQTEDPRFANVAKIHADMTLREFLRPDGSVSHIIEIDPATGDRVAEHPGQGYCLGSSWSRGQAWGLYGFTLAYINTKDARYLEAAKRIAGYFVSHIRPDGLTDCDFCQPEGEERIDNIAGACAACGLMELAKVTGEECWQEAAERLVDGLIDHCCDWSEDRCGVLTHCTASYHDDGAGRHTNITYGDYFLVEALAKLQGTDPMLWL